MSSSTWHTVTNVALAACWGTFLVVWVVGAIYNARRSPAVRRRGLRSPWIVAGVAIVVVFRLVPNADWNHVTLHSPSARWAGLAILVASTAFTLWARVRLGLMWSSDVVARAGHQLRTDGPYSIVRHPIYTGILGMLLGSALLDGLGRWTFALVAGTALVLFKVRAEERLMSEEFPDDYPQYRRRVPALVPLLRRR